MSNEQIPSGNEVSKPRISANELTQVPNSLHNEVGLIKQDSVDESSKENVLPPIDGLSKDISMLSQLEGTPKVSPEKKGKQKAAKQRSPMENIESKNPTVKRMMSEVDNDSDKGGGSWRQSEDEDDIDDINGFDESMGGLNQRKRPIHYKNIHWENAPENIQCRSSEEYMQKVMYKVPLNKLYKVFASCNYNERSLYCPVLVKIMDKDILKKNFGKQFLLQVWTIEGILVFERSMHKPVCNFCISDDKFLFQEEPTSPTIFFVRLYLDKPVYVYKLNFDGKLIEGLVNTVFQGDKYVIPDDQGNKPSSTSSVSDINDQSENEEPNHTRGSLLGEYQRNSHAFQMSSMSRDIKGNSRDINGNSSRKVQPEELSEELPKPPSQTQKAQVEEEPVQKSVSEMYPNLIKRTPDKMIEYISPGYIMLAYCDTLIFINVQSLDIQKYPEPGTNNINRKLPKTASREHTISNDHISVMKIQKDYKIISIQNVGSGEPALVIEDLKTRVIRFLKVLYSVDTTNANQQKFKLVQLGGLVSRSNQKISPLLKYRGVVKIDPNTGLRYHIALVLRLSGRFEVYSDFMLVDDHFDKKYQCVDIETTFNRFYLQFVERSDQVKPGQKKQLKFETRSVKHAWRNRIGINSSSVTKTKESSHRKWSRIVHALVSKYVRLFTCIINYSMYILVSHRNMISVFAMDDGNTQGEIGSWVDTIQFTDGHIRSMFLKKRPKKEREDQLEQQRQKMSSAFNKHHLICFIGTHTIRTVVVKPNGDLLKMPQARSAKPPGRIVNVFDAQCGAGILVLTDGEPRWQDFERTLECKLNTFSLSSVPKHGGRDLKLSSFKNNEFRTLLKKKDSKECLDYDSDFRLINSNTNHFRQERDDYAYDDATQDDNKELDRVFGDAEMCTVLYCVSRQNQSAMLYPLAIMRDEKTDHIKSIHLITSENHTRKVEIGDVDEGTVLEAHFVTSPEFGDSVDSLIEITNESINIYEKTKKGTSMQPVLTIKGLNIRSVREIHESFLYAICDEVQRPFSISKRGGAFHPQADFKATGSGFYVIDLSCLMKGKVEKYKISSAISGMCDIVNSSRFSDRFCYIQHYDQIAVIPFPHLNEINCVGMGNKHEYAIWREKNGFFTALDKDGNLTTWSLITGKILYSEKHHANILKETIEDYEVYKADEDDITYTRNHYNFKDCSLNLLKSVNPITEETKQHLLKQTGQEAIIGMLEKKLKNAFEKNAKFIVNLDSNVNCLDDNLFTSSNTEVQTEVVNSEQQRDIFHFKVMELRSSEDTKKESLCRVRFHFLFKLLRQHSDSAEHEKNDWTIGSNPIQRLYLSHDTKSMMEVINNTIARVYHRVNIDPITGKSLAIKHSQDCKENEEEQQRPKDGTPQQVKWKVSYTIRRFPKSLAEYTSIPYLFSPNFTYQFDFNFSREQFVIKKTRTQEVYMYIPKDLLDTTLSSVTSEASVKIICSRVAWKSENQLRIVNLGDIDCIFELSSTDPEDKDPDARYLKLVSVSKIDNLHVNKLRMDVPHMIHHPMYLRARNVLARLIRINQSYKKAVQHAVNTDNSDDIKIVNWINKVNYLKNWGNLDSYFNIEQSFTLMDWIIIEKVNRDASFQLENINDSQKIQLCFNIFPSGHGILHMLALNSNKKMHKKNHLGDQMTAYYATRELFETAEKQSQFNIAGAIDGCSFEIPILQNINGYTVVDICLGSQNNKFTDMTGLFKRVDSNHFQGVLNLVMAEEIFFYIKDYSMLHSSYQLQEAVTRATEISLPNIKEYLESRLIKPDYAFASSTHHGIKKERKSNNASMGSYGQLPVQIWGPEKSTTKVMFDERKVLQPMNLKLLDLPFVFKCPSKDGFKFIEALTKVKDLDTFSLKSIQIILDAHKVYWGKINLLAIGLPMGLQLIVFWYWSNIILPVVDRGESHIEIQEVLCKVFLIITALYFLLIESSSIYRRGYISLKTPTKIFNFVSHVMIMINIFRNNIEETSFWTMQSWLALAIWLRFILWLRSIQTFSWLIRMINECMIDMTIFMSVLFIGVTGFADAFQSIEKILTIEGTIEATLLPDNPSFYQKYMEGYTLAWQKSFLVVIGEFDDNLGDYRDQDWLIFFICVIFNIILLLNLLIAIISETYSRISTTSVQTGYRELAFQMHAVQETLFGFTREQASHTELLFVAKVIGNQDISDSQDRFDELQEQMDAMEERLTGFMEIKLFNLAMMFSQKLGSETQYSIGEGSQNGEPPQMNVPLSPAATSRGLTPGGLGKLSTSFRAARKQTSVVLPSIIETNGIDKDINDIIGDKEENADFDFGTPKSNGEDSEEKEKDKDLEEVEEEETKNFQKKNEKKEREKKHKALKKLESRESPRGGFRRQESRPIDVFNQFKKNESALMESIFGASMPRFGAPAPPQAAAPVQLQQAEQQTRSRQMPSVDMQYVEAVGKVSSKPVVRQTGKSKRLAFMRQDSLVEPPMIQAPIQRDFSKDIQQSRSKKRTTVKRDR